MFNLNAMVDYVLHPEIPYFEMDHLITGWFAASITAIIFGLTLVYIRRLEKTVDESRSLEDKLQSLIFIDELTGLCNRRGVVFMAKQQLKLARRQNRKILVLYGDLNNLKIVNDELGHKEGDLMLIETADVLTETFRDSDIIGRIGGDEFIVFSMDAADEDIALIKERFQRNIDTHNSKRENRYKLSISVGISVHNSESDTSFDEMLQQAEEFMYENKKHIKKNILPASLMEETNIFPQQG